MECFTKLTRRVQPELVAVDSFEDYKYYKGSHPSGPLFFKKQSNQPGNQSF